MNLRKHRRSIINDYLNKHIPKNKFSPHAKLKLKDLNLEDISFNVFCTEIVTFEKVENYSFDTGICNKIKCMDCALDHYNRDVLQVIKDKLNGT